MSARDPLDGQTLNQPDPGPDPQPGLSPRPGPGITGGLRPSKAPQADLFPMTPDPQPLRLPSRADLSGTCGKRLRLCQLPRGQGGESPTLICLPLGCGSSEGRAPSPVSHSHPRAPMVSQAEHRVLFPL